MIKIIKKAVLKRRQFLPELLRTALNWFIYLVTISFLTIVLLLIFSLQK